MEKKKSRREILEESIDPFSNPTVVISKKVGMDN